MKFVSPQNTLQKVQKSQRFENMVYNHISKAKNQNLNKSILHEKKIQGENMLG